MMWENHQGMFYKIVLIIYTLAMITFVLFTFGIVNIFLYAGLWGVSIVIIVFASVYFPLKAFKVHQEPCAGKIFIQSFIRFKNIKERDKLLGFEKQIDELKISFKEKLDVNTRQKTMLYKQAEIEVLRKETEDLRKHVEMDKEASKLKEIIDYDDNMSARQIIETALRKTIFKEEKDIEIEVDFREEDFIEESSKSEDSAEDKDKKGPNESKGNKKSLLNEEEDDKENSETSEKKTKKRIIYRPKPTELDQLGVPRDKQLEMLENYHIYRVNLYHSETFEGYEGEFEFSQAIFIMPGPIHEVFQTSEMVVYDYDDYRVRVQGCTTMMVCFGFVHVVPIFFVFASETQADLLTQEAFKESMLQQGTIHHLRTKITNRLIDELVSEQQDFQNRLDFYITKTEMLAKTHDFFIQDIIADNYPKLNPQTQKEVNKMKEDLIKSKKWKPIAVISLILFCMCLFGVFILLTAIMGKNVTPPEEASLLINFFNLTKNISFQSIPNKIKLAR